MATFGFFGGADPFRELRRLQSEMDRVMGALSGPGQLAAAGVFPAVNVYADQGALRSWRNCPASTKTTSKSRRTTTPSPSRHSPATLRAERSIPSAGGRSGAFSRSIQLPYRIDPGRIEAHLENGVLRLSLARPEDKPRRITIRA